VSIVCTVTRRFTVKDTGAPRNVELSKILELPDVPTHGVVLDFGDGTPPAAVTGVRFRCSTGPWEPGCFPPSVEVRIATEPGAGLDEARAAAWTPVEAP